MPRNVTVTFADGTSHVYENAPDDLTPEQAQSRAEQEFQKPVTHLDGGKEPSTWETVKHKTKLVGSDIIKGMAGLPALILDVNAFDPLTGEMPKEFGGASKALQGSMETPVTKADKWQSLVTQGAAGGIAGPGGAVAPIRSAVTGVGGAVGSEVSADLFGEGLLQRLLGGLVGGIAGGSAAARVGGSRINTQNLSREAAKGLTPELLQKAQEFMRTSAAQGVTVDFAQALEAVGAPSANITTLRNTLANSQQGNRVQEILHAQPTELSIRATTGVANMPGSVFHEHQTANNLAETATKRLQQVKDARTTEWETVLTDAINSLRAAKTPAITSAVDDLRGLSAARKQLEAQLPSLRQALSAAQSQDATAVRAANAQIAAVQEQIKKLQEFSLPRGQTSTNRGNFMDLPQRGVLIEYDNISRGAQAAHLERNLPPAVENAPSLQTTGAQRDLLELTKRHEQALVAESGGVQAVKAAREDLKTVTRVPPELVAGEVNRLRRLAAQSPRTAKATVLNDLASRLEGLTDAKQLNEVLKEAVARTKTVNLETPGINTHVINTLHEQVDNVRTNFETAFAPYKQANAAFRRTTEEVYNPMKQGMVGQVAGKGYKGDVQAPLARAKAIFETGVDPQVKVSPIRSLAAELAKVDKTAFADAAKTHYSGKVAEAFDPHLMGAAATNADAAERLWNSLFKNEKQFQGMRDTVASIAKTYGLSEKSAVTGLENLAQITKALKHRPQGVGGLSRADTYRLSGHTHTANALRIFGFLPFERAARTLEDNSMRNVFADFDRMLTTPEGAAKLIELSKVPPMSNTAVTILATMGGVTPVTAGAMNSPGIIAK